jgi:hypothetical protein
MWGYSCGQRGVGLVGLILIGMALFAPRLLAQGCVTARHMTAGLVSEGIWYLEPNQWDVFTSYRYLHSDTAFEGGDERPDLNSSVPHLTIHSIDIGATYAISRRFSATLILPFTYGESSLPPVNGMRHSMFAGGLGDIRLLGNAWLLNPVRNANQNISLSLGFKAPTGDDSVIGDFYTPNGIVRRAAPPQIQPGDGGWGIDLELQGFAKVFEDTFVYAGASYLSTPQEHNGVRFTLNPAVYDSIPDQ